MPPKIIIKKSVKEPSLAVSDDLPGSGNESSGDNTKKKIILKNKTEEIVPNDESPIKTKESIVPEDEKERLELEAAEKLEAKKLEAQKAIEEAKRLEAEAEAKRLEAEAEAKRLEAEAEAKRLEAEAEAKKLEAEAEAKKLEAKAEAKKLEAEAEAEAKRLEAQKAIEEAKRLEAQKAIEEARRLEAKRLEFEEAKRLEVEAEAKAKRLEVEARKTADENLILNALEIQNQKLEEEKLMNLKKEKIVAANKNIPLFPKVPRDVINSRYNFSNGNWMDKGTYFLNNFEQGTDGWKKARNFRLTASNFGYAVGLSNFEGTSPIEVGMDITKIRSKVFSDKSIEVMAHGTRTEPKVRDWYSKQIKKNIVEVGLAVPKWEVRIGGSLDGDIEGTDGCIEIKCPQKMYQPLVEHAQKLDKGWEPPKFYHEHIWATHYAQMQGCMKITNKKWCHYIVYCQASEQFFQDHVEFNADYWDNFLYPKIQFFLDNILEPLIKDGADSELIKDLL
jgi:hypothetical protein